MRRCRGSRCTSCWGDAEKCYASTAWTASRHRGARQGGQDEHGGQGGQGGRDVFPTLFHTLSRAAYYSGGTGIWPIWPEKKG